MANHLIRPGEPFSNGVNRLAFTGRGACGLLAKRNQLGGQGNLASKIVRISVDFALLARLPS
jgi:hypothetical protein